jgi:hypothetical protein
MSVFLLILYLKLIPRVILGRMSVFLLILYLIQIPRVFYGVDVWVPADPLPDTDP